MQESCCKASAHGVMDEGCCVVAEGPAAVLLKCSKCSRFIGILFLTLPVPLPS